MSLSISGRETRLLDKSTFDDPSDSVEAGSTTEADMLAEEDREWLVKKIQDQDQKLYELETYIHLLRSPALTKKVTAAYAYLSPANRILVYELMVALAAAKEEKL